MDPGLATFGAALLGPAGALLDIDALSTEPGEDVKATRALARAARKAGKKSSSRKGKKNATDEQLEDRARRIREILDWLDAFAYGDDWVKPDIGIAEAGRAMRTGTDGIISVASGMSIAIAICWKLGIPLVWCTPREWRRSLVPNPASTREGPSEKEIEAAHSPAIRERVIATLKQRGKSISLRGHAFDSHAMGQWGLRSSAEIIERMRPGAMLHQLPRVEDLPHKQSTEAKALGAVTDFLVERSREDVARIRRQHDGERAQTDHDFKKSNLITISDRSGTYDTYRCSKCGATAKRFGLSWPPRLDAKQPKGCK